jgi:hypothetical protein
MTPELPKLHICHPLTTHFNRDGWTLHMHQGGNVSFQSGPTTGLTYSLEEGLRAWAMSAVAAEREACAALVEYIAAEAKKSMTPAQILLSRDEPKAVADALTAIAAAIRNRGKS